MPFASAQWGERLNELADTVAHRASDEESELFPKAQETIGTKRAKELDEAFRAEKKSIMARL